MARSKQGIVLALTAAAVVLAVDVASKWAVARAAAFRTPYHLAGGLRIAVGHNTGISFGRFAGGGAFVTAVVAAVAVGVVAALIVCAPRYRPALGLVLGGAVGNLIDRVRLGAVVDFIGVYGWPSFNVADIAIVAGTLILVFQVLRGSRA